MANFLETEKYFVRCDMIPYYYSRRKYKLISSPVNLTLLIHACLAFTLILKKKQTHLMSVFTLRQMNIHHSQHRTIHFAKLSCLLDEKIITDSIVTLCFLERRQRFNFIQYLSILLS